MAQAIRDPAELLRRLELPTSLLPGCQAANAAFSLRVPESYLARMEKGNPKDPLLRQVLPLAEELASSDDYIADPVGDLQSLVSPGLLHKYQGRVLLITTPACAIHCRYCFRRHFPYQEQRASDHWQAAIDYLRDHQEVEEVILSGGDPLSLNETRLSQLTEQLAQLPQIRRLRLHSRQPIVLPERINQALLDWLAGLPWPVVLVVHCNHPNELSADVATALSRLHQAGITLLNQAVLLAGVNDSVKVQKLLSEKLFDLHILPYYLHRLDKVASAQHFDVPLTKALEIMTALRNQLPGYLVPRFVVENPGEGAKSPLY